MALTRQTRSAADVLWITRVICGFAVYMMMLAPHLYTLAFAIVIFAIAIGLVHEWFIKNNFDQRAATYADFIFLYLASFGYLISHGPWIVVVAIGFVPLMIGYFIYVSNRSWDIGTWYTKWSKLVGATLILASLFAYLLTVPLYGVIAFPAAPAKVVYTVSAALVAAIYAVFAGRRIWRWLR